MKARVANLTAEERMALIAPARATFDALSDDEKDQFIAPAHAGRDAYWASVAPEAKTIHLDKLFAGQKAYWERRRVEKKREAELEDGLTSN